MTEQARETQTFTDNALGREALKGNQRVIAESREQARETPEPLTPEEALDYFEAVIRNGAGPMASNRNEARRAVLSALRAATPDSAEHIHTHDCPDCRALVNLGLARAATPDPAEPCSECDAGAATEHPHTPDRAASTVEPGAQWSEHEGDDRTDRGQSDRRDGVAGVSGHRHDAAVPRRDGPADDAGPSLLPAVRDQSEGPVEPVGGSTERLEPGYDFSKAKRGVYFERATGHPDRAASTVEPGLERAVNQWVELYQAHVRGDDLAPIFERHVEEASANIVAALTPDETA
jgi:hypothetical protein